ncbi:MAG: ExeA family protein [Bacillota bacterium]
MPEGLQGFSGAVLSSTAVRALYDLLDRTVHPFLYIADSSLTPKAFYREVLEQFGLQVPFHARQVRRRYDEAILEGYRRDGRQPVLVLDEAHLLGEPMLQEIRFLMNFHMDSVAPLSLILVGQPELRSKLRLKTFEAIVQRIQVRYHLACLSEAEVTGYIEHHMRQAGADRPIYAEQAVKAVALHSRGLPRQINNLCTGCLWDACARGQRALSRKPTYSGSWPSFTIPTGPTWALPGRTRAVAVGEQKLPLADGARRRAPSSGGSDTWWVKLEPRMTAAT